MAKPLVAIVGRPNVGKSTFFNKLCGKRISIVDDSPGVTRDRIYADAEWCGHNFRIVDTGGIDIKSDDVFQDAIRSQVDIAIDFADVIVFVVDGREGLTQVDEEVAEILRKTNKKVILVVNKLDNFEVEKTYEFYSLGFGDPFPISCEQAKGLGEVLDEIVSSLDKVDENDTDDAIKIAIVGRPNVGKSSLTNKILGFERAVVSDVMGTTRDATTTEFIYNKNKYAVIDTAGLRRQRSYDKQSVEGYSVIRSMEAIERADVVLIVFDATQGITEQDVRIAGYVNDKGKPSVIVINKWDLVDKNTYTMNEFEKNLKDELSFMSYFKSIYVSAVTGQRLSSVIELAKSAYENSSKKIPTGKLNELLGEAILSNEPPYRNGKKLKINYITQKSSNPPTFLLFCNDASLMHFSYLRYLENRFRQAIDFSGTPITFITRSKGDNN